MNAWAALKRAGVLGINRRNLEFILPKNPRRHYPRVDDKLITKRLCTKAGIPVPELLASASNPFDLGRVVEVVKAQPSFVMKPARGAMGNGTLVVREVREGDGQATFLRAGGRALTTSELLYHGSGIIAGLYSLGGRIDTAMIEELLVVHEELLSISYDGVPDVRVILYRGVPVMSMMRLPTKVAGGRANLHQGAVGAGIDIDTGLTCHAVLRNEPVKVHPDTKESVVGRAIPAFERVLEIATRAADESGLGYVGADVVVDARKGPVILELNARPGLSIQIANRAGLVPRLEAIDAFFAGRTVVTSPHGDLPVSDRLALGRDVARRLKKGRRA